MKKKENYNYFNEFIMMTDYIVKSANILKNIIENFNVEKLDNDIQEVHALENEADKIVHKTRNYLIRDFLPPIDRSDIALICKNLDNIEDGIDEVLINFKILDITEINPDVMEIIDVLIKCTVAVKEMFLEFNNLKNADLTREKVVQVKRLEELGDRTYESLMYRLYKNEKNPINLIKWTNIYSCLEDTIDTCEQIGDCIEDVIIKNS